MKHINNFKELYQILRIFKKKIDQIYTEYPKTFELLAEEVSNRVTKSDLDNVMYSQLEVVDRNFKEIQEKVKGVK